MGISGKDSIFLVVLSIGRRCGSSLKLFSKSKFSTEPAISSTVKLTLDSRAVAPTS